MKTHYRIRLMLRSARAVLGGLAALTCLAAPALRPHPVHADPAPLPDLRVLTTDKHYIGGQLDHFQIWVFISNGGNVANATPLSARLELLGPNGFDTHVRSQSVGFINPNFGTWALLHANKDLYQPGTTFRVVVDPNNTVAEANETNNTFEIHN